MRESEKIKSIVMGKLVDKTIDKDFEELSEEVFGEGNCFNSSEVRKRFYGIKRYIEIQEQEKINGIDDNELIKEIDNKRLELEKEKIRFQDQKREYKKYLRQDARFEHIQNIIKDEIRNLSKEKEIITPLCSVANSEREAVLILSDWHIGVTNNNHWNTFNLDIAKKRISKLLSKTIEYCTLNEVNTIHIELLGDLCNGYLHIGNRIENEEDVVSQVMTVSEMLSEFATELSAYIPHVYIYSATGNHGRCSANIKESLEIENFERLIPWYMKTRLVDNNRIKFIENEVDGNIIVIRFLNEVIFATHGHMDKFNSAINNLSRMLKEFPTEMHLGHTHAFKEFDEYDMTTTVNGTLSGTDDFAKRIRKSGSPMQTLMIYNSEGRECTYKIKLN